MIATEIGSGSSAYQPTDANSGQSTLRASAQNGDCWKLTRSNFCRLWRRWSVVSSRMIVIVAPECGGLGGTIHMRLGCGLPQAVCGDLLPTASDDPADSMRAE